MRAVVPAVRTRLSEARIGTHELSARLRFGLGKGGRRMSEPPPAQWTQGLRRGPPSLTSAARFLEEASTTCANWPAGFENDFTCLGGGSSRFPSALIRGGDFDDGTEAGPFAVWGRERPSSSFDNLGFRGAR